MVAALSPKKRPFTISGDWLSIVLPRGAAEAYARFCEIERTPEWLSILRSATVTERDHRGRPQSVAFLCRLRRATIGYTLTYRYNPAVRRVAWATPPGSSLRVRGSAHFQDIGPASCLMTYHLDLALGGGAPRFDDDAFSSHAASATLADFRDFVLRQPA